MRRTGRLTWNGRWPTSHEAAARVCFSRLLVKQLAGHGQVRALVHQLQVGKVGKGGQRWGATGGRNRGTAFAGSTPRAARWQRRRPALAHARATHLIQLLSTVKHALNGLVKVAGQGMVCWFSRAAAAAAAAAAGAAAAAAAASPAPSHSNSGSQPRCCQLCHR